MHTLRRIIHSFWLVLAVMLLQGPSTPTQGTAVVAQTGQAMDAAHDVGLQQQAAAALEEAKELMKARPPRECLTLPVRRNCTCVLLTSI